MKKLTKKRKTYIVDFFDLTEKQRDSIDAYVNNAGPFHNGSTYEKTIEIEKGYNPDALEKLLLDLGYKNYDTVMLRFKW